MIKVGLRINDKERPQQPVLLNGISHPRYSPNNVIITDIVNTKSPGERCPWLIP